MVAEGWQGRQLGSRHVNPPLILSNSTAISFLGTSVAQLLWRSSRCSRVSRKPSAPSSAAQFYNDERRNGRWSGRPWHPSSPLLHALALSPVPSQPAGAPGPGEEIESPGAPRAPGQEPEPAHRRAEAPAHRRAGAPAGRSTPRPTSGQPLRGAAGQHLLRKTRPGQP